jgi:hypothetical protein
MREVEAKYENMSRERLHGKQPHPKPSRDDDMNADSTNDSDNESEDPARPGTLQGDQVAEPVNGNLGSNVDGNNSDESDDGDYVPPETRSNSSDEDEVVDSDEFGSDCDYDSYGLADL